MKLLFADIIKTLNPHAETLYSNELYGETGIDGLRIDFNFGLRLDIPEGNYHVKISDYDTEQIFFDEDISNVRLISSEGYFIRWQVEVLRDGEPVLEHIFDPEDQDVLMFFISTAMGDILALLPYVEEFRKFYACRVHVLMIDYLREITQKLYPELHQVEKFSCEYYATYYMIAFMGSVSPFPMDGKMIPLEKIGGTLLGLKLLPEKPQFFPTKPREIPEPYVCISVQSSTTAKSWLYSGGWEIVVDYLLSLGYRVLCIDKNPEEKNFGYTIRMPKNAENFTGNRPILDRANMLYHAEFFVGLSSGLSWLANAVDCPVVMIAGFSRDWYEFSAAYRVANRFVCNGCFNDLRYPTFNQKTCARYVGTDRELECQKKISPRQVINAIEKLILEKNLLIPVLS